MTSSKRTRELSDILASYGDVWTFTEAQETPVGELLDDEEVDADLRDVIARMRERYDFDTSFDDETLAVLVRRFYAGDGRGRGPAGRVGHGSSGNRAEPGDTRTQSAASDDEQPTELDFEAADVRAARFELHLFHGNEAPRDDHEREAMREASRVGHRWNAEFETVLSAAGYPIETSWNPLGDVLASTDEGENVASAT